MKKRILISVTLGLTTFLILPGQTVNNYLIEKNEITIKGTSNLHDWIMEVEEVKGSMDADVKSNKILSINSLILAVNVNSIISGKSLMDKKAYKALKSESYPEIHFTLSEISEIKNSNQGQFVTANGILSVAGIKRNIPIKALSSMNNEGDMSFAGSKTLKMSDFNIEPPTAIFGTLKTGDIVVIEFNVLFKKLDVLTKKY